MQMTIIEPTAAPETKRRIRVGAYCRVSTDASDQKHSFNAQKTHFSMLYANSADYELVDIYADMGISGTKAAFRP
jgi:DNA invertase Pin-like site-specific DNA recombinase